MAFAKSAATDLQMWMAAVSEWLTIVISMKWPQGNVKLASQDILWLPVNKFVFSE